MEFLYRTADAAVLPTRGEGFNLPAAEGMARGLPVIVTRHSGHLDFCNDANTWLLACTYELSNSHLAVPNSYWARPSVEQLVATLKMLYRSGRPLPTATAARACQGQRDATRLRWRDVAGRIERFVDYLDNRPAMTRKLRLGWISTYNTRCGIASYSAHLLEHFDKNMFDITILATSQEKIGPDPQNVQRLWSRDIGSLAAVKDHLVKNNFDVAMFQHNHKFYDDREFVDLLMDLAEIGITTFVTLHRTKGLDDDNRAATHRELARALQTCAGIFVHAIADVNRLREWGVTENVVLLPHGVIDRPPLNPQAVRGLLGLSGFGPVIGSFGFLLPGKGLTELIYSFALILRAYPDAYLLMLNADYPVAASREERERCLALARLLELDSHMRLLSDFLEVEEALFLLNACDAIVYPYQQSEELASGAVRLGLSAGRPVATTPVPVFADLSDIVFQLPGTEPRDIADGVVSLLADENAKSEILRRQRDWVRANSWATQASRISNIMLGCFEEARGVELRVPVPPGSRIAAWPTEAPEDVADAASPLLNGREGASSEPALADIVDLHPSPQEPAGGLSRLIRRKPALFRKSALKAPRSEPKNIGERLVFRADRARDSRDWIAAAQYYREALDEEPVNAPIWVQYGHALKEAGDVGAAESAYRKALELDAGVADTHLQLGHALKLQGRKIEAGAAYLRSLALDPALEHARVELKALGWARGRIEFTLRREQIRSGLNLE